jgi:hypothetical protein
LLNCDWVYLLSIKRMPSKSDRWSAYLNHSQLAPSAKLLAISIVETARPGREGLRPGQTGRLPGRTGTWTGRLFQSSRTRPDDRLGSVGDMKLCHDVGNVVPHGLGCQCELGGDRGVVVTSRDHGQDLTLPIR